MFLEYKTSDKINAALSSKLEVIFKSCADDSLTNFLALKPGTTSDIIYFKEYDPQTTTVLTFIVPKGNHMIDIDLNTYLNFQNNFEWCKTILTSYEDSGNNTPTTTSSRSRLLTNP